MTDIPATDQPQPPDPTPETVAAAAPRQRTNCPGCGSRAFTSDGWTRCGACTARFRIVVFAPLLDAPEMAAGAGRCANHPGKDAVTACGRCGAFACDVCVTRTGENVLCPGCFGLLHERGQLDTTQTGRTRWDYVTLGLSLLTAAGSAGLASPLPLALSVWLLYRARTDRWIRVSYVSWALVLSLLQIGGWAVFFVAVSSS